MRTIDSRVSQIAMSQHHLVTLDEFLDIATRRSLDRRLASGMLIRRYNSVFRLASAPVTWHQELLAACLAGGKPSAGSFRAAAFMTDLPGGEEIVEITSPRHRRAQYDGVIAHESNHLQERDLWIVDSIPITRPARTLCDLAWLVENGEMSRPTFDHAILEAFRRNLIDLGSLWAEHERLGGTFRRGGEVVHDALQRFVPPQRSTETTGESKVLILLREHGIPEPIPQYWLTLLDGERIRLDFAWPSVKASLEWDPYKYHGDREAYERMMSRTRRMRAMGWDRISLTDDDFDNGMPESLDALRHLLVRL